MKNFLVLSVFLALGVLFIPPAVHAQTRQVTTAPVFALPSTTTGNFVYFGGYGQVPGDSLQVSDSIAYFTSVAHINEVEPVHTWYWNKIGSGTATITLTYWWSNDGVNYFQCTQGAAEAAYTKTFSPTANTWYSVDFSRDSIRFPGRYLKTYFITSATASVKGKLINQLKINIK